MEVYGPNILYHSLCVENIEKLENFMIINIVMEANDRPSGGGPECSVRMTNSTITSS